MPDDLRRRLDRAEQVARFAEASGDESALRVAEMVVAGLLGATDDGSDEIADGSVGDLGSGGPTDRREAE
ncbi:MAG TPA: hypothetical protein VL551_29225 [Actinospica sp.]|nr:hypothetical protein [Actinospica sp.]